MDGRELIPRCFGIGRVVKRSPWNSGEVFVLDLSIPVNCVLRHHRNREDLYDWEYRVFLFFILYVGMTAAEKNSIIEMLAPMLDIDGIELVDVETHSKTLRLLIYKRDGLSVADCQMVNQVVRPILEVHKHLANYAQLEVASPGIDRPLRTAKDFQRNCGRTVQIEIIAQNDHTRQIQGTVVEVHPEEVVLTQADGKDISVKISHILNARIHLKW